MSKGWGFKIDYAKAIADDDARIAWAELSMRHGWYKRPVGDHGYVIAELWELILYFPDAARARMRPVGNAAVRSMQRSLGSEVGCSPMRQRQSSN